MHDKPYQLLDSWAGKTPQLTSKAPKEATSQKVQHLLRFVNYSLVGMVSKTSCCPVTKREATTTMAIPQAFHTSLGGSGQYKHKHLRLQMRFYMLMHINGIKCEILP